MSAPTDITTELMTEHLQYAPLTFIDDVINSANAILYQAMDAFETYLRDTVIPSIPSNQCTTKAFALDAPEDAEREALYKELEFGMAQVETLLENAVDRNFDAFELYVLRNVFNMPDDADGYLRLAHHQVWCVEARVIVGIGFHNNTQAGPGVRCCDTTYAEENTRGVSPPSTG